MSALAQVQSLRIAPDAPQAAHNLAIELEQCAETCSEPLKSNSTLALDYLADSLSVVDFSILGQVSDSDEFIIGEAINVHVDAVLEGTNEILNQGVLVPSNQATIDNTSSNVVQVSQQALITQQQSNSEFLQGFNGDGLFLVDTVDKIYSVIANLTFNIVLPSYEDILTPIFITFFAAYLTLFFVKRMFGNGASWGSLVFTSSIFLITTTMMQGEFAIFIDYFAIPTLEASFGLASWFVSHSATTLNSFPNQLIESGDILAFLSLLEYQWARIADIANTLWDVITSGSALQAIANSILGGAVYVGLVVSFTFTLVMFAFQIIYSIIAAFVFLLIAPMYLLFFAFPATRGLTITWIRGYANYLVIPVIGAIAITIMVFTVEEQIVSIQQFNASNQPISNFPWGLYWALLIISLINGFLAARIGDIAAFLTGGASVNLGRDITQSLALVGYTAQSLYQQSKFGTAVAGGAVGAVGATVSQIGNSDGIPTPSQILDT